MRNIVIILFLTLYSVQLLAVKAFPSPIKVIQPDGTELTIRLHGDEFHKYSTTIDGHLIKKDENGFYNYATVNESGIVKLSNTLVSEIDKRDKIEKQYIQSLSANEQFVMLNKAPRLQKIGNAHKVESENNFPLTGSPRSLVILVNYLDISFVTDKPNLAFTNLLNQQGYNTNGGTGSARDYFIESSFAKFSPQFDVVGPFNLPKLRFTYGTNDTAGNDVDPQQMVIDACKAADLAGVDFSKYDLDNNGLVDNIFIYYAGNNEAEGGSENSIWPHRWSLNDFNTKFDGKSIYDYACTSELRGSSGSNMCGIGTFCHEFGHVLGLVDYYHTTSDTKVTLKNWSIMDEGAYLNQGRTPPSYSAYDRFYLNWLIPKELKSPANITINPLISSNEAYLICKNNHNLSGSNPDPIEFFILENRRKVSFDRFLPGEGMLIWHIDYDISEWNNNSPNNYTELYQTPESHMRVYLQPTDISLDIPVYAFVSGSFKPTLWNGENINKPINFILQDEDKIRFKFLGGEFNLSNPVATQASQITDRSFIANWQSVTNASAYYLTVYNKSVGESIQSEGFDNGLSAPDKWVISASALTTSDKFSGIAVPAVLFKNKNEIIETEKYLTSVNQFSFYVKSMGSDNGTIKIEASNGTIWKIVDEITVSLTTAETKKYDFDSTDGYIQFKLTYSNVNNNIAIDDLTVRLSELITYNCKNKFTTLTTDTLMNLISGRTHYYMVKASDRTLNPDNTVMYENFTDYSNSFEVSTLEAASSKHLRVEREFSTGQIFVFVENINSIIYIYNTTGQLIRQITPYDLRVDISPFLLKHNLYLIFSGNKSTKITF